MLTKRNGRAAQVRTGLAAAFFWFLGIALILFMVYLISLVSFTPEPIYFTVIYVVICCIAVVVLAKISWAVAKRREKKISY